jgi:hypothetical protein
MRLRPLVVATALAVATVAVPASASAAVPGCHLEQPAKVVIDHQFETVRWYLGDDCYDASGGDAAASWDLQDPSGSVVKRIGIEIPSPIYYYDFHHFGDTVPKGDYRAVPVAIDPSWMSQNSAVMTVKYGSRTTLSGSRKADGSVTLTALATSWSGAVHDWYPRKGVQVQLLRRYAGETGWTWLKNATASSSGRAQFRLLTPKAGEYRMRVVETTSAWSSTSSTYRVP